MRVVAAVALLLSSGCGDDAIPPPTPPPPTPPLVPDLGDSDPDPEPPFDFRRAILHPEQQRGAVRTCIVSAVSEAPLFDPNDPASARPVAAHHVQCAHPRGVYEVRVLVDDPHRDLVLAPPTAAEASRQSRRLSLRIESIDESARRPTTQLLSSRPAPPLNRRPSHTGAPTRSGFDFSRAATEPALFGSRKACVIRAASHVLRARPEQNLPDDVVVTIPATCVHEGGRSNTTLLFTEATAEHALTAGPSAIAHGTLESAHHLRVIHITPPER